MRKNTYESTKDIVSGYWSFKTSDGGNLPNEALTAAATLEIVSELRALNQQIRSLGIDGIHDLIREGLVEVRALRRRRLARRKK